MTLLGIKQTPFDQWPRTPAAHFRLYFFAAISHLLHQLNDIFNAPEKFATDFPFLAGYANELARDEPQNLDGRGLQRWWHETLSSWEAATRDHLPLRAVREANKLDHEAMIVLLTVGLIEEDSRFGLLFGLMQGAPGQQRPTVGLLNSIFRESNGTDGRAYLRRLDDCGLISFTGMEAPKPEWKAELPTVLWDLLRGEPIELISSWCRYRPAESLAAYADLILPSELREQLDAINGMLSANQWLTLVVRGPEKNGRKTLLGAIARKLGKGLIEIDGLEPADNRWRLVGPLSSLLGAMPAITIAVLAAETFEVPAINSSGGPVGFVLGKHGGLGGKNVEDAITITVSMPDRDERRAHWQQALVAMSLTI